ncbi:MAG: excinuclease ABC subunit UvrA, partial [Candidatus Acidiferrales bacterium]
EGLSPSIAMEQKTTTRSPRSTVGTVTEIYDYLRVIYSAIGTPHCPQCGQPIARQSTEQIVQSVMALKPEDRVMVLAPVVRGRKGEYKKEFEKYAKEGYVRARVDGELLNLDEPIPLDRRKNHTIEIVVDRLLLKNGIAQRLEQSIETALKLTGGLVSIAVVGGEEHVYSEKLACPDCGISVPQLEPRSFSFNSPYGACPECHGLGSKYDFDPAKVIVDWTKPLFEGGLGPGSGSNFLQRTLRIAAAAHKFDLDTPFEKLSRKVQNLILHGNSNSGTSGKELTFQGILPFLDSSLSESNSDNYREWLTQYMSPAPCAACHERRLRPESLAVRIAGLSIADFTSLPLTEARAAAGKMRAQLTPRQQKIAALPLGEIAERLDFLLNVGLGYLTLNRSAATLSGGEAQRIRLATQIGSRLRGVMYVLDEPSIGLHARDNGRLLNTLETLRDLGNTVLVVEHDEETIRRANYVVDLGPGAGKEGGYLVAAGSPEEIAANPASLTGQFLSGRIKIAVPEKRRSPNGKSLSILGATGNNLKNIDVVIPLGLLTVISGVSGSGKSTLVNDILYRALAAKLYRSMEKPGAHGSLEGAEYIDKVVQIDQAPIGRTPRSNPATYTGVFAPIREIYAMLPESRERGYRPGRFSFNVKGGRCEACQGDGLRRIEMNFLPDVYVTCEICRGKRYNAETLAVRYKGYSISDLLDLPIEEALKVMENIPAIQQKLQTLVDVGLGYVQLGQSSTTLSGGEAQRTKLAKELSRRQTGRTLYILDEPTTGLHFDDVNKLMDVLNRLVTLGNTVLIIEHNMDVIKQADWIIDLGPEGGEGGGRIVAQGSPEQVARSKKSYTGQILARALTAATGNHKLADASAGGSGSISKTS